MCVFFVATCWFLLILLAFAVLGLIWVVLGSRCVDFGGWILVAFESISVACASKSVGFASILVDYDPLGEFSKI